MTTENITPLRSHGQYHVEAQLAKELDEMIHKYDGLLSRVAVLGILEVLKHGLLNQ